MATELNFNKKRGDNEDELKNASAGGPSTATSMPAPGGMGQRQATPSGRPNVQQYLNANQGAGEKLSSGIQGGFQKQANQVNQGINKTKDVLNTGVNPLENKLGDEGSQKIQSAFKDPSSILSQQDQLDEYRRLQNKGYSSDISNLQGTISGQQQNLTNQVNKLGETTGLAGTEGGRFQLLRNTFGQPNYSQGQQKLDQLFLQAQPGVNRSLQKNLQGVSQQTGQQLNQFNTDATNRFQNLTGLVDARAQQAQNLIKGGIDTGLEGDISGRGLEDINSSSQQRLVDAQNSVAQNPALRTRLANNQLTAADLKALGLSAGTQLYDTDLSEFINQQDATPTLAGVADPQEAARYRALQQLSGDASGDIFGGATEIGGFKPYEYNQGALIDKINERRNYNEITKPVEMAKAMAGKFDVVPGSGGMESARGPYESAGFANQLRAAKNIDEVHTALAKYNEHLLATGAGDIHSLRKKRPELDALMTRVYDIGNQRSRKIQQADSDLESGGNFGVS